MKIEKQAKTKNERPSEILRYRLIKSSLFKILRSLGLFNLSKKIYRKKLCILTFHGFSIDDEHLWYPGIFHSTETFKKRLDVIKNGNYPVLSLDEAYNLMIKDELPDGATVITLDDGFYNNYLLGVPLLIQYGFKHTIYVASYYVKHQEPVFRLVMQYAFWKNKSEKIIIPDLSWNRGTPLFQGEVVLSDIIWTLIEYGERELEERERQVVARDICILLGVDYDKLKEDRVFGFLSEDELLELDSNGFTRIELHSHRHSIGSTSEDLIREIRDNREVLNPILGRRPNHFCYPSGVWNEYSSGALESEGCLTGTLIEPGLNDSKTQLHALKRYLDRDNSTDIEMEAELSGFATLLRSVATSAKSIAAR